MGTHFILLFDISAKLSIKGLSASFYCKTTISLSRAILFVKIILPVSGSASGGCSYWGNSTETLFPVEKAVEAPIGTGRF
jgi:hypothetical protein